MSSKRRTQRFTSILMTIGVAALGCHRQLSVKGGDFEPDAGWTGTGGASGSGSPGGVLDGIEQGSGGAPVVGTGGRAVGAGGVGEEAGTGGTPVPTGEASGGGGDAAGSGVVTGGVGGVMGSGGTPGMVTSSGGGLGSGGVASSGGATGSGGASGPLIGNLQMLATLNDIQPLAVGTNGVSVLQYSNAGEALVLYVDWSGKATTWYRTARSSYGYLGASGAQHVALLYTSARYEIALNGDAQDLSGSATTYKESITANGRGFAWVNFEAMGSPPVTSMTGSIVLQDWAGGRIALTDALRYRSRPQMSDDWLVYVEYASIAPGSIGQIQVHGLTAGAVAKPAAASAHHQDRPVTDGDWVVWEEYLSSKDSVIRARNITSGEVRDLSSLVGFRTSPDIKGTRVVWQDERSGGGEIYLNDLATTGGERVVVSGKGYSAAPRLTSDGLVWIESYSGSTGLVKATWTR